jgi:predicted Rossmann fold nucleotide-binding protein DprA/Smf involved in DNA uptake
MTIQNDLKALQKELAKLNNQTERLQARLVKLEKREVPVKSKPATAQQTTAADTLLSIIMRSKKGVSQNVLIDRTGFNAKKVQNIIYRLHKSGKIKKVDGGVYTGT